MNLNQSKNNIKEALFIVYSELLLISCKAKIPIKNKQPILTKNKYKYE